MEVKNWEEHYKRSRKNHLSEISGVMLGNIPAGTPEEISGGALAEIQELPLGKTPPKKFMVLKPQEKQTKQETSGGIP